MLYSVNICNWEHNIGDIILVLQANFHLKAQKKVVWLRLNIPVKNFSVTCEQFLGT